MAGWQDGRLAGWQDGMLAYDHYAMHTCALFLTCFMPTPIILSSSTLEKRRATSIRVTVVNYSCNYIRTLVTGTA